MKSKGDGDHSRTNWAAETRKLGIWTNDEEARRNKLFARLKAGEIGAKTAEREADELGVGPLEIEPDFSKHDPMKKPGWTLAMTLVWIATRDLAEVMEYDNDYRRECLRFTHSTWYERTENEIGCWSQNGDPKYTEQAKTGWNLDRVPPVTAVTLAFHMLDRQDEYRNAKTELWNALSDGALSAHGVNFSSPHVLKIPAHDWPRLGVREYEGGEERLGYNHDPLSDSYKHVLLNRSEVLSLFTPAAPMTEVNQPSDDDPDDELPPRRGRPPQTTISTVKAKAVTYEVKRMIGRPPIAVENDEIVWRRSAKMVGAHVGRHKRTIEIWRNDPKYIVAVRALIGP